MKMTDKEAFAALDYILKKARCKIDNLTSGYMHVIAEFTDNVWLSKTPHTYIVVSIDIDKISNNKTFKPLNCGHCGDRNTRLKHMVNAMFEESANGKCIAAIEAHYNNHVIELLRPYTSYEQIAVEASLDVT